MSPEEEEEEEEEISSRERNASFSTVPRGQAFQKNDYHTWNKKYKKR